MSIKTYLYEKMTDISNLITTPSSTSKFLESGQLTPEEFVQAGDMLVQKCPTWAWRGGKQVQSFLPADKQYLVTLNVPCHMRVSAFESKVSGTENSNVETDDGEGGWLATHINEPKEEEEDIPEIPTENSDDEAPEINLEDLSIGGVEEDDSATLSSANIQKTRSYDISICYDQYHKTPRVWLFGYDENRHPLKPDDVLKDVSEDHANKTVTIQSHPYTGVSQAYIHPCRHAEVMKKIVSRMRDSGKFPRADQYLFLFLKFIHAAIPTIEYDYTMEMDI
eukprot:TRINITY_DN1774_c0_g1_i1.p2 TRINITY_DN1774_c0_g1~~TRINITY_DN1774_c0_g1_i1.p2  ORF type:complete len:279 (-),score=70.81 TRINITY_DN1774_c0_g1_i1:89-925(-)